MRKQEKKMLLILFIIAVIIIGGLLIWKKTSNNTAGSGEVEQSGTNTEQYVQVLEDGSKVNVSETLLKTKTLGNLEIANIQLKETGGITTLLADVTNKGTSTSGSKIIKVEILDKAGNVLSSPRGVIDPIVSGGTVQLNLSVTADVANAYDFRISEV